MAVICKDKSRIELTNDLYSQEKYLVISKSNRQDFDFMFTLPNVRKETVVKSFGMSLEDAKNLYYSLGDMIINHEQESIVNVHNS